MLYHHDPLLSDIAFKVTDFKIFKHFKIMLKFCIKCLELYIA